MDCILVTGGAGFIGRRLVHRHLEAGDCVRVLSRAETRLFPKGSIECHVADIVDGNENILERFVDGADIVYHCAGEILNETRMPLVNAYGTERLATIAAGRIGRWVQLSTIGVYGFPRTGIVTESTTPAPPNIYETSKLDGDNALISVAKSKDMPWSILRPTIVFGHDMPNNSLRSLIRAIESGHFFFIGQKGAYLPYVHADDVVEALMLCGCDDNALDNVFNISDDVEIEEFVSQVASILGCKMPGMRFPEKIIRLVAIVMDKVPGFPLTTSRVDALTRRARHITDKIESELGYSPVTGWRKGLNEVIGAMNAS